MRFHKKSDQINDEIHVTRWNLNKIGMYELRSRFINRYTLEIYYLEIYGPHFLAYAPISKFAENFP